MLRKIYDYELYTPEEMRNLYYGCHIMCREVRGKYQVVALFIEDEFSTKKERNKFFKMMKIDKVDYADYTIKGKTLHYDEFVYATNNIKRLSKLHRRILSKTTFKRINKSIKEEIEFQKNKFRNLLKTAKDNKEGLDDEDKYIYSEEDLERGKNIY